MGRKERKSRLDKGESGEFLGFAAFAAPASVPGTMSSGTLSAKAGQQIKLSPIYLGNDSTLSLLFPRIGQKRDATTKGKALRDLREYFADENQTKKQQIEALCHFSYLYHSKLHYESTARVRAGSLECFLQASSRLPKAWNTLVENQQPELIGMILAGRADSAADVRLAANQLVDTLKDLKVDEGVWEYSKRILSYGKPKAMHEELFQKSSETTLSEKQKEELEERFERIVGTAIAGLQFYLQNNYTPTPENNQIMLENGDVKFLWKALSSSKASLRRKTFGLMSSAFQKAPSLVDSDKISKLLFQSLSSEKEPSNIPSLLETLISFVSTQTDRSTSLAMYTKPLGKLFKKGCLGATQWAPTVLPIIAILPQGDQPNILTSVWQGRGEVASLADELEIVAAVAETATFLLQKECSHDFSEVIGKCWLQALISYLKTTQAAKGPAQRSLKALGKTLARDWNQLNQASLEKPSSTIHQLKDWFWNEQLPPIILDDAVDNQLLLTLLVQLETEEDTSNQWAFILKRKYHSLLAKCQGSSGLVPTIDKYELWIAILNHLCTSSEVFDSKEALDKFVMNDLLRWMVIHTSTVSDQANSALAKKDFLLYRLCLPRINQEIWDSILRELVAAQCDLNHLQAGLSLLLTNGSEVEQQRVQSPVLEDFTIQVARDSIEKSVSNDHAADDEYEQHSDASENWYRDNYQKTSSFLRFCAGLDSNANKVAVIQNSSIQAWVDCACSKNNIFSTLKANPVLDTLVLLAKEDNSRLDETTVERIMLQTWRQGGALWRDNVMHWLTENVDFRDSLIELASKELKALLNQANVKSKEDADLSEMWSERAVRVFRLFSNGKDASTLPQSPLALIGFADSNLWRRNEGKGSRSFVSQCMMKLLSHIDKIEDRRRLFSNFESDVLELFIILLMGLSGADTNLLNADNTRRRRDSCAMLLNQVKAASLKFVRVKQMCNACITLLASLVKEEATDERICRGIAVLSQLVELTFRGICPIDEALEGSVDKVQLDTVKKGDTVWYITNSEDPTIREKSTIVKIHTDLPSELYFTIKVSRDGVPQERQTVGERLRNTSYKPTTKETNSLICVKDIASDELIQRLSLTKCILNELVTPLWENWRPVAFELLSLVISQSGLLGNRGIGTEHHMIFQKLLKLQGDLLECFSADFFSEDKKGVISILEELSFALGYGHNIPPFSSQALISFDPSDSVRAIISHYEDTDRDADTELDNAVARWLTVSAASIDDEKEREQAYMLLFRLSAQLLESGGSTERFSSNHFVALRAVQAAQKASHKFKSGNSILEDSEAEALVGMSKAFAHQWELDNVEDFRCSPVWQSNPVFNLVFESSLIKRRPLMARASKPCIEKLVGCLYTDTKRWYSTKLLFAYANEGAPLHSQPGELNEASADRIELWCSACKLIEEEVEELEDDVDTVAQWIPERLMNDVETWYEVYVNNDFVLDEKTACGRLLSWIVFLQIAEVASGKDAMNRPAFTSYVTKCKSVEAILTLALSYVNIGTERKVKLEKVIDIDDMLKKEDATKLSELASYAIFRTIGVFPTIAKHWWDMGCPNYMTQPIRDFVESSVSPEILRRELYRMKQTSSFGEMNVKGSLMSREVTATYVQDDFTLTVVIKIPLSFPFRRAEVDCSKTYGVPESRWKRWALQITQMLNNQGGTLSDALLLWKENVDKEFEGVEPCPVCYSVLHVKTHKLPSVECNTCHNRFHMDCLSQWFRSSGKSNCVICQQPWSGTRVL
jgi:hypothetical protein